MSEITAAVLEALATRVKALAQGAQQAEQTARAARGLPESYCLDFQEFPFLFAKEQVDAFAGAALAWTQHEPESYAALSLAGYARLARGEYTKANGLFAAAAAVKPTSLLRFIKLGEPAGRRRVTLPPVEGDWPVEPALFVACDPAYLKAFVPPLVRSLVDAGGKQRVHVHLMGPAMDRAAFLATLASPSVSMTQEDPGPFVAAHGLAEQDYYGAARFVRFAEALEVNPGPLWMSDVDALVNRDPAPLFALAADAALRIRPARWEPWHQFSACLVMGRPTARGYFNAVADIVANGLAAPFWGLDQYALFSAWLQLKAAGALPAFKLLGPAEVDLGWDDASIFWMTAGAAKGRLFQDPRPADPTKFERRFWEMLGR